jgi:transposase
VEHLGIDLGSSRSSICVVNDKGALVLERTVATLELDELLKKRPPSHVVVESCAESRKLALMARKHGHQVRVVPTSLVRSLGVGARNIKTDKRDARNLATASFRLGEELPQVHVRSDEAASMQDLVRARASLVSQRTSAINFVRSQLRKELLGRGPRCDSKRVRIPLDGAEAP